MATGVQSVDLEIDYNSADLNISGVTITGLPTSTWIATTNSSTPGRFHNEPQQPGRGTGKRSANAGQDRRDHSEQCAIRRGRRCSSSHNIRINEITNTAVGEEAVHKVAYFGDLSGDGTISTADSSNVAQISVGLGQRFPCRSNWLIRSILGDVTGDGTISSLDASFVAQKSLASLSHKSLHRFSCRWFSRS